MINLKINFLNRVKILIYILICSYSVNTFSVEVRLLELIENNWNESKTISGKFQQKHNDQITSGKFYIQKPYQSSFAYDDKLENIITSKFFINITDKDGYLIDRYPLIKQPIYKLLSSKVDFKEIFNVLSIDESNEEISISLLSKNTTPEINMKVNLVFNNDDYSLKNWEIIDELGQSTYLEFTKIRKNISIDPKLFEIK